MGKRVQRIPSWPGVKRFTPTKAVYICADQLVTSSHSACGEAADHTFRFADHLGAIPGRLESKCQIQPLLWFASRDLALASTTFVRGSLSRLRRCSWLRRIRVCAISLRCL